MATPEQIQAERDALYDRVQEQARAAVDAWVDRVAATAPTDPASYQQEDAVAGWLLAAGLLNLVQALPYAEVTRLTVDLAAATTDTDPRTLSAERVGAPTTSAEQFVRVKAREAAGVLRARMAQATVWVRPTPAEVRDIVQIVLRQQDFAKTLETALAAWERSAQIEIGQRSGSNLYVYMGPMDKLTRPFCRAVLTANKAYTPAQVNALNKHPLLHKYVPPNVAALCGGYGCRHMFTPVSEGFAKANGYDLFQD